MSNMDDNAFHADALIREERHIKQNDIAWELDILLNSAHSIFHGHLNLSMCVHTV